MKPSTWFLVAAVALIGYVFWSGGERRFAPPPGRASVGSLNYDVVAVSQGLTPQAQALNLEKDLDVSLLPEIGKQSIREAAQQGLREQAFLQAALRGVSDRVREISTIDLNADGTVDPILVRPEPAADEGYVLLSLQVPTVEAYPLPSAADAEAWKAVETVEVATMTVSLNRQELAVQATGSPYVYPESGGRHYVAYDRTPSFLETYFAIRMLDWLFFPPMYGFWGPGWGYGGYRPVPVPVATGTRGDALRTRGYERASPSATSAVRGRSGEVPRSRYQRANPGTPPRTLGRLQASRGFARRDTARAVGSGGFGRSGGGAPGGATGGAVTRSAPSAPRYGSVRGYSRGFGGGFGRGVGRGLGGFGRGFGRGFRMR